MGLEVAVDEPARQLGEQTCAVAGAVGGLGASVIQTLEALDSESRHPIARHTVEGGDEPDTAGVVPDTRIEI
jgi:hypothetical protein